MNAPARSALDLAIPLVIAPRFAGPPGSANGGYTAGRLAAYLPGPGVRITLRQPPPLATTLEVTGTATGQVRALHAGALVAEAEPAELDVDPVEPVSFGTAAQLSTRYRGLSDHPFPGCFVCGIDRAPGDGLALRPGPLDDGTGRTACPWTPDLSVTGADGRVLPEIVWAALDCPGGWAVDVPGRPMVLGRITGQVDAVPEIGEPCVVMGRVLGREGRKAYTATTAYDTDGRVLGRAHAVWLEVDPQAIGRR